MADTMLWNNTRLNSVKASKIREIGIYDARYEFPNREPKWKVLGWYNSNENFYFGYFDTLGEAQEFVENLHIRIRGEI